MTIKRSILAALVAGGINIDTSLSYVIGQIFFDANFWVPNQNVPYERLSIRAGAVPSAIANDARVFMNTSVIPQMVAWVKGILALPSNSPIRQEQQSFRRQLP